MVNSAAPLRMKLRLVWIADAEDQDSYSARETRVLLRAVGRLPNVVPLWFAVRSSDPPHLWDGVRVFPIPEEALGSTEYLSTLLSQQRPHLIVSDVARSSFPGAFDYLSRNGVPWVHRLNPDDTRSDWRPPASRVLLGGQDSGGGSPQSSFIPYIRGLDPAVVDGADATTVLQCLLGALPERNGLPSLGEVRFQRHIVMRQQLFCNSSLAQVMFELTNALVELDVPTVAQDELLLFAKQGISREEGLVRAGASKKYQRVLGSSNRDYDPENSTSVHFGLFKSGTRHAVHSVFPSLAGREILYTTGNHTVTPQAVRQLMSSFDMILAPSCHVLRPYLEAGLSSRAGAVIPHGIDPEVFSPATLPFSYPTKKDFKFLQTSFPWVCEKGFDLCVQAFGRAFSSKDDVSLILRTPRVLAPEVRKPTFSRLESIVREQLAKPGSPEVLLIERDAEPNQRGGFYTAADCYVHPLRAEGFGMTILEAMACGLPVIATAWSGPADFLSPRYSYNLLHSSPQAERTRNGTLLRYHVEPDLDHLIYLMRYVYERRDEARALGANAAHAAHSGWTWKHAATKLASALSFL